MDLCSTCNLEISCNQRFGWIPAFAGMTNREEIPLTTPNTPSMLVLWKKLPHSLVIPAKAGIQINSFTIRVF